MTRRRRGSGALRICGLGERSQTAAHSYEQISTGSFLLVVMFIISTTVPSLVLSADVALRKLSEERYKALFEEANDIVATLDLNMVLRP